MLAHIAGFMERPRDKASLAACCRSLHTQSGSWWHRLDLHLRSDQQAALLSHWLDGTQPAIHSLHLEATRTGLLEVAFGLPSPRCESGYLPQRFAFFHPCQSKDKLSI